MKPTRAFSFVCLMIVEVVAGEPTSVIIDHGYIRKSDGSRGAYVGTNSSALQSNVIDQMFGEVDPSAWIGVSIINSSMMRSLDLFGDYLGDAELKLPSLFRFQLHGSIAVHPSASGNSRDTALVRVENASYVAILGGTYNASGKGGYNAISLVKSTRCAVRKIRATSDSNAIAVFGGSENEIAQNDVGPGARRCIWTLTASRALVHSNKIHHCQGHSLDFDAYTKNSVAFNNTCFENGQQGIFVEETASDNVIVANTFSHNDVSGIGVYSYTVGPVKGNTFIGNRILNTKGTGITAGGLGHDPNKHSDNNIFVDNFISGNGIGVNLHHGDTQGDFWTGNVNEDDWIGDPSSSKSVVVFDPLNEAGKANSAKQYTRILV